jgi:hypothetical protein
MSLSLTQPVRSVWHTGQPGMCVQKSSFTVLKSFIYSFHLLFVPNDLYMCCISFISGKTKIMSSERPSTQYYERRKKIYWDVDADEGSSRDVPLWRSKRAGTHWDLPLGRMDIDLEIEEEEHIVESSYDDDVKDQNYRISPRVARGVVLDDDEDENKDDVNGIEDDVRGRVEQEDEKGAEGNASPQQRGRILFHFKPSIRRPHKTLSYNTKCYRGKGTTKEVKRLQKIDPRPQQKGAINYRFHTHF